eukprot:12769901-Alexandrium_andersonii.AAC.1
MFRSARRARASSAPRRNTSLRKDGPSEEHEPPVPQAPGGTRASGAPVSYTHLTLPTICSV